LLLLTRRRRARRKRAAVAAPAAIGAAAAAPAGSQNPLLVLKKEDRVTVGVGVGVGGGDGDGDDPSLASAQRSLAGSGRRVASGATAITHTGLAAAIWEERWSESRQAPWWSNKATGETSWTRPSELDDISEWEERFSDRHQALWWKNKSTGAVTWTRPAKVAAATAVVSAPLLPTSTARVPRLHTVASTVSLRRVATVAGDASWQAIREQVGELNISFTEVKSYTVMEASARARETAAIAVIATRLRRKLRERVAARRAAAAR
jgi:hypothetical protein